MVLGFQSRQPHVAQNIIVGLDFDGTIAIGNWLRIWYAKKFFGIDIKENQTLGGTWPKEYSKDLYRRMADDVDTKYMMQHYLAPGCKSVLNFLHGQSFRFAVVTSRAPELKSAAVNYIRHHGLPIKYVHATDHTPKEYLCERLRARAFLDDGLYRVAPLASTFVKPFFIRQPWNVHEPTPPASSGIVTITSWAEFRKWLLYMKKMHEAICFFNRWENAYFTVARIAAFWKANPGLCSKYFFEYGKLAGAREERTA